MKLSKLFEHTNLKHQLKLQSYVQTYIFLKVNHQYYIVNNKKKTILVRVFPEGGTKIKKSKLEYIYSSALMCCLLGPAVFLC